MTDQLQELENQIHRSTPPRKFNQPVVYVSEAVFARLVFYGVCMLPCRDATTAEKLRGTKVWVPTLGRLRPVPSQRPGWVLGAGGGRPHPL